MALSFECGPEELFDKIYGPLQIWLQQNAIAYPWSSQLQELMQQRPMQQAPPQSSPQNSLQASSSDSAFRANLPDSYAVWVSEVMLQQTRVETVRPYYLAWMARWPNLEALAKARDAEVLKLWEGLGYYNRALNLHKSAQLLCQNLTSTAASLPKSAAELRQLPGIGAYIAAAVASISHNQAILALDTNGKRILSRLYQCQTSLQTERRWQEQHRHAIALCQWRGAANISLIQVGQQLCRAKNPNCSSCPLRSICVAAQKQNWAEFPRVTKRSVHKIARQRILCLDSTGRILLMQNCSGHLKHLWRFPTREDLALFFTAFPNFLPSSLKPLLKSLHDENLQNLEYIGSFQHAYLQTREKVAVYRMVLQKEFPKEKEFGFTEGFIGQPANEATSASQTNCKTANWRLASPHEMQQLTLAGPYRKFYRELCEAKLA